MTKQRKNTQGTTLLELLFTVFILSSLVYILAMFPLATERSAQSTNDQRASILAESIRDAIKAGIASSFNLDEIQDLPIVIKVVHDGLFHHNLLSGQDEKGALFIELPHTAIPAPHDNEEEIVLEFEEAGEEGSPFYLLYESNDFVRYPDEEGEEVYKIAQDLLEEENTFFNKYDDISDFSFDIEVRQAVKARRPRRIDGSEIAGSPVRIYELIPDTYEFTIRIYRKWRRLSEREENHGAANDRLIRVYTFHAAIS